jgi:hypothetical protein
MSRNEMTIIPTLFNDQAEKRELELLKRRKNGI